MFVDKDTNQLKSIILDINSIPGNSYQNVYVDIYLEARSFHTISCNVYEWKHKLKEKLQGRTCYYVDCENEEQELLVDFSDNDMDDSVGFKCYDSKDKTNVITKSAKSFMRFKIPTIAEAKTKVQSNKVVFDPVLKESFAHNLTKVGLECLRSVEAELIEAFNQWTKKGILAPLISLCQSSGSGKSKMALELLLLHAGFYSVFREVNSSGYPKTNQLSSELFSLILKCNDPSDSMLDSPYSDCGIGKILDFIARIVCQYVRDFVSIASKLNEKDFDGVFAQLGKRFLSNESIEPGRFMVDADEMKQIYTKKYINQHEGFKITVEKVSEFIKCALDDPLICIQTEVLTPEIQLACEHLKRHIKLKFPFLLVIDEAQLLSASSVVQSDTERTLTGFEAFRRALTYFDLNTKILVLTLGTNSTVVDLNPEVHEYSTRYKQRSEFLKPLILSSNFNILSREFPMHKIRLSHDLLNNPLFFKYLCTLGHGMWSSLPYDSVISQGSSKFKGSSDFIFAVWMILTGMSSNPSSQESNNVVANHMAHLLEIRNETKELLVAYPSEPILAYIAHSLIQDMSSHYGLFEFLKRKFGAIKVDKSSMAEYFAEMIVLRAVQDASIPRESDFKNDLINICKMCPDLVELWLTKYFVLEELKEDQKTLIEKLKKMMNSTDTAEKKKLESDFEKGIDEFISNNSDIVKDFRHMKTCTVSDFLISLFGLDDEVDLSLEFGIPREILDGLINVTHFVHLNKMSKNIDFYHFSVPKFVLPQADDRIPDATRNVIDQYLLSLMLIRSAGIVFPPNYYGYDFGVPVLLKGQKEPTFIGFQVKRSQADTTFNVYKTQPLLHYVKCSSKHEPGENNGSCCVGKASLDKIYCNHISIILSLDSESTLSKFQSAYEPIFYKGATEEIKNNLEGLLLNNQSMTTINRNKFKLDSIKLSNHDKFYPIVHKRIKIDENLLLSQCIWDDSCIIIEKEEKNSNSSKQPTQQSAPYIQRLFSFSTRGWERFIRLFKYSISETYQPFENIIQGFLDGPTFFRADESFNDKKVIKQITYDMNMSFIEFSDELSLLRSGGRISTFDALTGNKLKKEQIQGQSKNKRSRTEPDKAAIDEIDDGSDKDKINNFDQIDYESKSAKISKIDEFNKTSSSSQSD